MVVFFAGRKTGLAKGFEVQKGNGFTDKFRVCIKWQNNKVWKY